MKTTRFLLLWLLISNPLAILAAADGDTATVTGMLGLAQFSRGGGSYLPVKPGTKLQSGDLIQTANNSALDLDFGGGVGTVRLLQSTTLSLPLISSANVQLHLKGGEMLGEIQKRPAESKFQIEISQGIAGVLGAEFRLNSRGNLAVVGGSVVFVEAPGAGEPVAHVLTVKESPMAYLPVERAVRPAPKELAREVRAQMKGRLPRR